MLKFIFIFLGIYATQSYALTSDYRFETFARSMPIGAYAKGEFAVSQKLWGKLSKVKPLYSFVRARSTFQTSGLINSARTILEYYPLAPIAVYSGVEYMRRDLDDLDGVECNNVTCEAQSIKRKIWGLKMAMAYKKLAMLINLKWHSSKIKGTNPFGYFEEQGTLVGRGHYDILRQLQIALSYQINSKLATIVIHKSNETRLSRQSSQMSLALLKMNLKMPFFDSKNFCLLAGGGIFRTRFNSTHPTVVTLFQWRPKMGLTLF